MFDKHQISISSQWFLKDQAIMFITLNVNWCFSVSNAIWSFLLFAASCSKYKQCERKTHRFIDSLWNADNLSIQVQPINKTPRCVGHRHCTLHEANQHERCPQFKNWRGTGFEPSASTNTHIPLTKFSVKQKLYKNLATMAARLNGSLFIQAVSAYMPYVCALIWGGEDYHRVNSVWDRHDSRKWL